MAHTAAGELTLIDAAEMARIRIGEHIRKKAEKIREKKAAAKKPAAQADQLPVQL